MRRAYVRLLRADAAAPPENGGAYARVLLGSLLTPTLCTAVIIWRACAKQIDTAGLVGATLMDIALWGISAISLSQLYCAARYQARRRQHVDALASAFADWVDAERRSWSSHQ